MAIASIQSIHTHSQIQDHQTHGSNDLGNLDSLVDPVSAHDMGVFHSTLQQAMQSASAQALGSAGDALAQSEASSSVSGLVSEIVDKVQQARRRVESKAAKVSSNGNLSIQDAVDLQEGMESYSLTVQYLSKAVSLATKSIDTIVHMQ